MGTANSHVMFTVEDIRQRYGVTEGTVLGWIHAGELKAVNVGRKPRSKRPRWRVTQSALDVFEDARTPPTSPVKFKIRARRRPTGDVIEFYAANGK